ncbi:hypothetical protein KZO25_10830 [Halomonas sp. ANAO-440]|uniref:DUF6746 family protein n=1 Tax=Halomonas sp. ANAO-440 TaxID=2861360 RepID=UPI001CAA6BA9|nr:DUF6746 family protein [Halomonas sp. ANAO-440]MBZ0330807.1 hypothetical protein [Halomonas sp. ANAO-440]
MKQLLISGFLVALMATAAHADDHGQQGAGQAATDLETAMDLLVLENARLDVLLEKEQLSEEELALIEQMSINLANALALIHEEVGEMATLMEEVQSSAAEGDGQRVRESGRTYLNAIQPLVKEPVAPRFHLEDNGEEAARQE